MTESSNPCNSTESVTLSDIAALLKHVISLNGIFIYATSSTSLFSDSGCCNRMAIGRTIFISKSPILHTFSISTVDGTQLYVNHIEPIATTNLSLLATFHIPKLTINLISIGQLCDLGLNVIFSFLVVMCTIRKCGR